MKSPRRGRKGMITGAWRAGDAAGKRAGWNLTFGGTYWDADALESLKERVPARDRSYDPANKVWWIAATHEAVILDLFPEFEPHLRQLPLF